MHVIGPAAVPWDAGTVTVGTRTVRRRAGLRPARAPSSRGAFIALIFSSAFAVFLLLPMAMGWHHTTVSRHLVLWWGRDLAGSGRLEAKFMYAADLPSVQSQPPLFTMPAGEGYWVVASSSPGLLVENCNGGCLPRKPVWSLAYVPDEAPFLAVPVGGAAKGTPSEARWPAVFDRLPDRAGPNWWPVVPPRVAAAPLAIASLSLGAAAIWRRRHVPSESA